MFHIVCTRKPIIFPFFFQGKVPYDAFALYFMQGSMFNKIQFNVCGLPFAVCLIEYH